MKFERALAVAGLATLATSVGPLCPARLAAFELVAKVVYFAPSRAIVGASDLDMVYAVELCQAEHDLSVAEGCARERYAHEQPARQTFVHAFGIDRQEVSNEEYSRCVLASVCAPARYESNDPRFEAPEFPVTHVEHRDAETYCAYAGGRLPTEIEWERAARGVSGRRFPWGRMFHPHFGNHGRAPLRPDATDHYELLAPTSTVRGDVTAEGVHDLGGNVAEWTSSFPSTSDLTALGVAGGDPRAHRIVRGGSWAHPPTHMRATHRTWILASAFYSDVGFRCAYDVPRPD